MNIEPSAAVCPNPKCSRQDIQVFTSVTDCRECGEPLDWLIDTPEDSVEDLENMLGLPPLQSSGVGNQLPLKQMQPRVADTFSCPSDISGCPVAKKTVVLIPLDLFNKWVFLAKRFPTEWIAYLLGGPVEGKPDEYQITGMYFPQQWVTPAHCEPADQQIKPGTIGTVHSHVDMKAYFSTEDIMHFNHQVEIVLNRRGEFEANGRIQLECGRYHRGPAEVKFTGCAEVMELENLLKENIKVDDRRFKVEGAAKGEPVTR